MRYPPQIQFVSSSALSTNHLYLDCTEPLNTTTKQKPTMDSSFDKFPELPTDLRLRIWEAACCHVVTTSTYSGLQYIDVRDHRVVVSTSCSWSESQGQSNSGRKNRSAYLYDSGLWKACKESKDIIAKHTTFWHGIKIQERGVDRLWKGTQQLALIDETSDKQTVSRYLYQNGYHTLPQLIRSA